MGPLSIETSSNFPKFTQTLNYTRPFWTLQTHEQCTCAQKGVTPSVFVLGRCSLLCTCVRGLIIVLPACKPESKLYESTDLPIFPKPGLQQQLATANCWMKE